MQRELSFCIHVKVKKKIKNPAHGLVCSKLRFNVDQCKINIVNQGMNLVFTVGHLATSYFKVVDNFIKLVSSIEQTITKTKRGENGLLEYQGFSPALAEILSSFPLRVI